MKKKGVSYKGVHIVRDVANVTYLKFIQAV